MNIRKQNNTDGCYDIIPNLSPGCYFIPLGGTDLIGMNFNVFGIVNNDGTESWMICDIGVSILQDKGLRLEMASPFALRNKVISGIVITHAHDDHIAGLIYILRLFSDKMTPFNMKDRIPVYATKFALNVLEFKLHKHSVLEKAHEHTSHFTRTFHTVEVLPNEPVIIGLFRVTLLYITHSTLESNMVKVEFCKNGKFEYTLLHTADWKNDLSPVIGEPANLALIKRNCSRIDMILCDSTNANKPGTTPSEQGVETYLRRLLKKYDAAYRIVVSFFATNVARVRTVLNLARETNRQVVLYGTSMIGVFEVAAQQGYITQEELSRTIRGGKEGNITNRRNERFLIICTGSQGENSSVLCRLAENRFQQMNISDSINQKEMAHKTVIIFASTIIPGNEEAISNLKNSLLNRGVIIVDTKNDGILLERTLGNNAYLTSNQEGFIHVSGHPCRDDLSHLIDVMKPDSVIPVHGDRLHTIALRDLVEEKNPTIRTIVPFDGAVIRLDSRRDNHNRWIPELLSNIKIKPDRIVVDGNSSILNNASHLRVRHTIADHGALLVIAKMTSHNEIMIDYISNVGCIPIHRHGELNHIIKSFNTSSRIECAPKDGSRLTNDKDARYVTIKRFVEDSVVKVFGKEPYVEVYIVQ